MEPGWSAGAEESGATAAWACVQSGSILQHAWVITGLCRDAMGAEAAPEGSVAPSEARRRLRACKLEAYKLSAIVGERASCPKRTQPDRGCAPQPWYRLRLPKDLEAQFTETTRWSRATYIQSWLLIFIVFNVLSLKMDFDLFGPEQFGVPAFLTLGVFLPAGLAAIAALHGITSARRQAGIVIGISVLDMVIV